MQQPYNDLKTPEMVERLKVFLEEMELVEQEPCFGHYIPTLNFSPWEIPQKPTFRPDNHYFQAAGQEPPQEPVSKPWYKQPEVVAMLAAIFSIWALLAFLPY
jgi:hypothetical protein